MQNLISVIIVSMLSFLGVIHTEPLTWRLVKVWLPVNVIFVGMLITSMFRYASFCLCASLHAAFNLKLFLFTCSLNMINLFCSLKYINVAMVTVLKNVTNVITALGEMYLFSKHHDSRVWAALFLMVLSVAQNVLLDLVFFPEIPNWDVE
jgi:GDP-mannose transporter